VNKDRPTAWYDRRERMWCIQLTAHPATYWRDDTGAIRYYLTAQDAYDALAAEVTP